MKRGCDCTSELQISGKEASTLLLTVVQKEFMAFLVDFVLLFCRTLAVASASKSVSKYLV